jgi:DNA gyrase subunit A
MLQASTRDTLYLITLKGRAASTPVYALPEKEDPADGTPWASASALDANARVVAAVAVSGDMVLAAEAAKERESAGGVFLLLGTAGGMVKKISVADLPGPSSQVYNVMNVADEDALVGARLTAGADEILLATSGGRAIRFKEEEVRAMGLSAQGVMGIKPGSHDDKVIGLDVANPRGEVFMLTDAGMGKRTPMKDFPTQGRYGVGVTAASLSGKQRLAGMCVGDPSDRVVVVTNKGAARTLKLEAAGRRGRAARGAGIVKLKDNEVVVQVVAALVQIVVPEPAPAAVPETAPGPKSARKAEPKSKKPEKASRAKVTAAPKKASRARAKPSTTKAKGKK